MAASAPSTLPARNVCNAQNGRIKPSICLLALHATKDVFWVSDSAQSPISIPTPPLCACRHSSTRCCTSSCPSARQWCALVCSDPQRTKGESSRPGCQLEASEPIAVLCLHSSCRTRRNSPLTPLAQQSRENTKKPNSTSHRFAMSILSNATQNGSTVGKAARTGGAPGEGLHLTPQCISAGNQSR